MKLLKIILFAFAIYFIRRFIQMYRVMRSIQEKQAQETADSLKQKQQKPQEGSTVVDADFKVIN